MIFSFQWDDYQISATLKMETIQHELYKTPLDADVSSDIFEVLERFLSEGIRNRDMWAMGDMIVERFEKPVEGDVAEATSLNTGIVISDDYIRSISISVSKMQALNMMLDICDRDKDANQVRNITKIREWINEKLSESIKSASKN